MSTLCRTVIILFCCIACTFKPRQPHLPQTGSPALLTGNIENGKALYHTCASCHGVGAEGNAGLHAPALVNLDSWYAYTQLKNFAQGIRGYSPMDTAGKQMAAIAQSLKDTLKMYDLIAYIETLPEVKLNPSGKGDIAKGERTYQTLCGSCHGPAGKGNEMMHAPRLNGLQSWYLKTQIAKFKTSVRGAHPQDKYGAPMVPMMALLKDERAIDDVIAYLQSTRPLVHE